MHSWHVLIALGALLTGTGALAQEQAAARLSASVPPVLVLRTDAQAGAVTTSGRFTEIRHAAVLRVKANCRWRLVALPSEGSRAAAWVRASVSGRTGAYQPVGGGGIMEGTPAGDTEIVLDYRVPAGAPVPVVTYQVQPRGAGPSEAETVPETQAPGS